MQHGIKHQLGSGVGYLSCHNQVESSFLFVFWKSSVFLCLPTQMPFFNTCCTLSVCAVLRIDLEQTARYLFVLIPICSVLCAVMSLCCFFITP